MGLAERTLLAEETLAFDRASARTYDKFGRLHVADCRISKANVCPYYGREIPQFKQLGLDANRIYQLYRDPAELEKAAPTFRNAPLLIRHVGVHADDAKKDLTVGTVGAVAFDGTYLVADQLSIWSRDGIRLVETEDARELSCGYGYAADMTPGVTPDGVAFDGVMRNIAGNHVTLVRSGRAGSDVIVADEKPTEFFPMKLSRPKLFAQLIASGLVAAPVDDAARLALDEKLAACTIKDAEDDPENPKPKDKGPDTLATDAQIESAIVAKGYVTADAAQQMANDAALKATTEAVKQVNELHAAREAVKPLVGVVAFDSAEAVYRFALEQNKIALDGIHPSAFPTLVAQAIAGKSTAPAVAAPGPQMAFDAIPGLARIRVG